MNLPDMENQKVVTRFAPSPTGFMHIGGVRTALFAWAWARKNAGTFILRIEDTDKEREVPGSIEHIQETLRWLGLEWDFGPDKPGTFGSCIQSERLDTYHAAAKILIDKGLAYPDPYSAEEIDAFRRAAHADKRPFLFRDHRPKEFGTWDGKRPLRFKVPEVKRSRWQDAVRGTLEAGEEALDDFILIKSDGYPTYNFAHIIDDMHMGVTHIMRSDEFISSTPKFLSLYEALGITPPVFVTLPPILREDKTKKLGKRDGAKDVLEHRTEGYLPDAMVNFLALIGWNPGGEKELFSREELLAAFDLSGIHTHGGVFNEEKLRWFQKEHLSRLDDAAFTTYVRPAIPQEVSDDMLAHMLPILRERTVLSSEIAQLWPAEYAWVTQAPAPEPAKLTWKDSTPEESRGILSETRSRLDALTEGTYASATTLKDALWDYATEKGRGAVLWPLRYALTGLERSPDPFAVASILGKAETLARIDTALALPL
jgi:glutamyl-tRNA synthetase